MEELPLARPLFLGAGQGEMTAHAFSGTDGRDEADLVEAVVDDHSGALGHEYHPGRHLAQQRQREKAVRDSAAKGRLRGNFRIDMDELMVARHVGEGVGLLLGNLDQGRGADSRYALSCVLAERWETHRVGKGGVRTG